MIKTSFGEMQVLLKMNNAPKVEYLKFLSKGRPHIHECWEYFFIITGFGSVVVGDRIVEVQSGDLITIPSGVLHWMEPKSGLILEGLLWYHDRSINIHTSIK